MIISISGRAGHGKDTVGKITQCLLDKLDYDSEDILNVLDNNTDIYLPKYQIKKFADKLKDIVCLLIGCKRSDLESEEFKSKPLGDEWTFNDRVMTPRLMLQLVGTDCLRNIVHPDVFVNSLMGEYDQSSMLIITDTRFPNELKAIKQRGGISIKVERNIPIPPNEHISESALDEAEFDYVIYNDGSVEDLIDKVREVLTKEGLM